MTHRNCHRLLPLCLAAALGLLLTACGSGTGGQTQKPSEEPGAEDVVTGIVTASTELPVTGGSISGSVNAAGTVRIYKGIPYAAPPVGERRWAAPQSVENWDGVRECTQYSAAAVQPEQSPFMVWTEEFIIDTSLGYSEDCLYLNVWAPVGAENAPVVVFIHGGGNTSGGASCDVYDGEEIARKGIVYVTVNYRVGIFGFLAHPELSAEAGGVSGNYALQDLIAALGWVRDNIATFGGDPDRVTISGQSAGSLNVNMLTVCPEAAGLFQNAVTMSYNPVTMTLPTLAEKEAEGEAVFAGRSLAEMRALSADEIQALNGECAASYNIDGKFVTGNYADTLRAGRGNDVNVLTGMVAEDSMLFGSFLSGDIATAEDYAQAARDQLGARADAYLAAYPAETDADVPQALIDSTRDNMTAQQICNARARAANGSAETYVYLFTHEMPGVDETSRGAFHTADVPYWINHFSAARAALWTDADYAVGSEMSDFLVNFAASGDPNGETVPTWTPYDGGFHYMELGGTIAEQTMDSAQSAFWRSWYADLLR